MRASLPWLLLLALACRTTSAPLPATPAAPPPAAAAPALPPLPPTPRVATSQTFHGVEVKDDYRWLEDGKDPAVRAWSAAQNARARAVLDALPGTGALRARITDLRTRRPAALGSLQVRRGAFFALRHDPAHKQQPDLVVLSSLAPGTEPRVLLDLMALDPKGRTAIDWFEASVDGSRVAVALSEGGSEDGTLHVYDVATGKETGDVIPRVQEGTGGGSLAWAADGKGFWYTRYPRKGERRDDELDFYQQVYFHRLGTPEASDAYAVGKEFPRIAEARLRSSDDGSRQLALVANGDGGDFALWVRAGVRWQRVAAEADGVIDADFGPDGSLWLLSKQGAPRRKVLRLAPGELRLAAARVVLDGQPGIIEQALPTATRVHTVELQGGPSRVRQFDHQGRELPVPVPLAPASTVLGLLRLGGDDVFFAVTSYLTPTAGFVLRARGGPLEPTVVKTVALADFSDAEVVQEEATSRDGTRVAMFILQPKGLRRDGSHPVVLRGYGGFGISTQPFYSDLSHVLLEQGVVQVDTALRGGGEQGEAWHDAGRLTRKQNVFDDFLACAQRLIELGYTTPERLGIEGGSNGGLLMGAAFTQRPALFRAVVSHVGIYDMLHVEDSANGQFNVTEYGTVRDPGQFQAMVAYSPYHRVVDGTAYPAILFLTGANDPRVDPMQSRKMTARLQAANPSGRPVLLRTSGDTGHGMGSPLKERIDQQVDVEAFLLSELGVTVR